MIGWLCFVEDVIRREMLMFQRENISLTGERTSLNEWVKGLVMELLKVMYGQWFIKTLTCVIS